MSKEQKPEAIHLADNITASGHTEREAFEAWWRENVSQGLAEIDHDYRYWALWQASAVWAKSLDESLTAAAPELLEACKNLLTLTLIIANNEYEDIALVEFEIFSEKTKSTRRLALADELAKARAAIAKATWAESSVAQPAQGTKL